MEKHRQRLSEFTFNGSSLPKHRDMGDEAEYARREQRTKPVFDAHHPLHSLRVALDARRVVRRGK